MNPAVWASLPADACTLGTSANSGDTKFRKFRGHNTSAQIPGMTVTVTEFPLARLPDSPRGVFPFSTKPGTDDATYSRYDTIGRTTWEIGPKGPTAIASPPAPAMTPRAA
jgi:hypothetical protein